MNDIHPLALFRYSVLGPLISRADLQRGELKATLQQLAARHYDIPGSRNTRLSEKTIEGWFYQWRRGGIEALEPKARSDRGQSKIAPEVQAAILAAKRENPRRSIRGIRRLLEQRGTVAKDALSRSAIHRLLKAHGLSRMSGSASEPEEYRAYVAEHAGDIWYGDVMHGPSVPMAGRMRKAYLVSLMDDASRLVTHSAFCPGETALDIEAVLKQAVLKRGLPKKLVIDNGPAAVPRPYRGSAPVWASIWCIAALTPRRERGNWSAGIAPSEHSFSASSTPRLFAISGISMPACGPGSKAFTTKRHMAAWARISRRCSATNGICRASVPWAPGRPA